jgi:RNA polymerase sigma factor (sigma-70 family)
MKSSSNSVLTYLRSLVVRQGAADDDRELLRRFAEARDGDAFAVLMQRYGPMVLNQARRIVGDEQLAEDVFQAAFLLLSHKIHTIRRPESLPCWLHGVAHRLALQARQTRRRRHKREARIRPTFPPTPLDDLTVREFLAVLNEELDQLPENYRAPLILCCLEGLSREEAAKRLGCSPDALKGRLERGRDRLRMRLEKRGLTLPAAVGGALLLAGATSPVPAALVQATLQAAKTGSGITPTVAALIQDAMKIMVIHKLKAFGAVVMLLALAGTGVGMMTLRRQSPRENTVAATDDKPLPVEKRVDLYGDPLPDGAVMRLGTLQRRTVGAKIAVTEDGKSIVGLRHPRHLYIWDAATGELRQRRELPESRGSTELSPDGRWIAQLGWEQQLVIWDVRTVEKVRVLRTEANRPFESIAISRDCKRVAAIGSQEDKKGGNDNRIRVWDLAEGKEIFRTEVQKNNAFSRLALSPDGKRLLAMFTSNLSDSGLYCWDLAAGRQVWQNEQIHDFQSVVFTADGKIVTSPFGQIVDLATGQTVELENPPPITTKLKDGVIGCHPGLQLALTPDGHTLFIPKPEGVIVWNMIRGKQLRTLQVGVEEVVVMPDGKSIITNDGSLQRWDLETGKPLWHDTFALGHIGSVNAAAFSADGKRLASFSADGSVRLWDAVTGRPLRVWRVYNPGEPSWENSKILDITPDGRWILSAGWTGPIKFMGCFVRERSVFDRSASVR